MTAQQVRKVGQMEVARIERQKLNPLGLRPGKKGKMGQKVIVRGARIARNVLPIESINDDTHLTWEQMKRRQFSRRSRKGGAIVAPPVRKGGVEMGGVTNGVEKPIGILYLISEVKDVKEAKIVAKAAARQYKKLMRVAEETIASSFEDGLDVWWVKKGKAVRGIVIGRKGRKLVVATVDGTERVPARKVRKGKGMEVVAEMPTEKRWRIGRKVTEQPIVLG